MNYGLIVLAMFLTLAVPFSAGAEGPRCEFVFNNSQSEAQRFQSGDPGLLAWAKRRYQMYDPSASRRNPGKALSEIAVSEFSELDRLYFKSQENSFTSLLTDQGVVLRIRKFVAFVKNHPHAKDLSAQELRAEFATSLGTAKVYRALLLTAGEAQKILTEGIAPLSLASKLNDRDSALVADALENENIYTLLHAKVFVPNPILASAEKVEAHRLSPLQSLTAYPELAAAVASNFGNKAKKWTQVFTSKKVYIFELSIPEIEIIRNAETMPTAQPNSNIESFYMGVIPAQYISKVEVREQKRVDLDEVMLRIR